VTEYSVFSFLLIPTSVQAYNILICVSLRLASSFTHLQGGLVSSHSSAQWLSVLATNDQHATHGRDATAQARTLSQAFKGQANWVSAQQALVEHRTARCEHLLHLLRTETIADAAREKKLLETQIPRKELRKRHAEAAMERSEAADRIMRVLQEYGILSGDEMADYYMYTINAIKDLPDDDTDHHHHHHGGSEHAGSSKAKSIAASSGDGDQSEYADSRPSSASSTSTVATTVASGATTAANVKQRNKAAAIKKLADDAALKSRIEKASQGGSGASSSTTAPLKAIGTYVPSAESYRPSRAHADASVFEKAGLAQTVGIVLLCLLFLYFFFFSIAILHPSFYIFLSLSLNSSFTYTVVSVLISITSTLYLWLF
jgi:hypothetical protein